VHRRVLCRRVSSNGKRATAAVMRYGYCRGYSSRGVIRVTGKVLDPELACRLGVWGRKRGKSQDRHGLQNTRSGGRSKPSRW
jgi:hypothetical protein